MDQAAILDHRFLIAAYTVTWVIQLATSRGWASGGARKNAQRSAATAARVKRRSGAGRSAARVRRFALNL